MKEYVRDFCQLWSIDQLILYFYGASSSDKIISYGIDVRDNDLLDLDIYFGSLPGTGNTCQSLEGQEAFFDMLHFIHNPSKWLAGYFLREKTPSSAFLIRFADEQALRSAFDQNQKKLYFCLDLLSREASRSVFSDQRASHFDVLESFGTIASSTLDADELFWIIYHHVHRVMDVDAFFIGLYMPGEKAIDLVFMVDEEERFPRVVEPLGNGIASQALRRREPILCNRTKDEILALEKNKQGINFFGNHNRVSKSLLAAPIIYRGRLIGVISVQSYKYNAYNENHLRLLNVLASQAGVAIENAHLFAEQHLKAKTFAIADEIHQKAWKTDSVDKIIQSLLSLLCHHFNYLAYAFFYSDEKEGDWKVLVANEGNLEPQIKINRDELFSGGQNFVRVLNEMKSETLEKISREDWIARFFKKLPRSLLVVPMIIENEADGFLVVAEAGHKAFSEDDARWFELLLSRLALSFQKNRFLKGISNERDRLMTILNLFQEGVHILDRQFNILFANRWSQNHLKRAHGEAKCYQMFFGLEAPCKECPLASGNRLHHQTTFEFRSTNGRIFKISLTKFPQLKDQDHILEIVKDITQEIEFNEKERKVQQLETAMAIAGTIAHELNQPLTGITGLSSLILEDLPASDYNYDSIREIENQANRLRDLIRKFQKMTKIEKMDYAGKDIVDLRRSIE
ncbi:MAG: GAF domain-containing protein [Calditrichaeota bacterium]|nr:MAG: GAF domain-containing protein [Calditrichota bacterium]